MLKRAGVASFGAVVLALLLIAADITPQLAMKNYLPLVTGPIPTPIPPTAVPPTAVPPTAIPPTAVPPTPTTRPNCAEEYPDVCIPPPPPDLNCGDIPYRRFRVFPPDRHNFDTDHDGIGCESG